MLLLFREVVSRTGVLIIVVQKHRSIGQISYIRGDALLIASSFLCLALSPSSLLLLLLLPTSARDLLHGRAMVGRIVLCYNFPSSSAHTHPPRLFRVGCRARGAKSTTKDDGMCVCKFYDTTTIYYARHHVAILSTTPMRQAGGSLPPSTQAPHLENPRLQPHNNQARCAPPLRSLHFLPCLETNTFLRLPPTANKKLRTRIFQGAKVQY